MDVEKLKLELERDEGFKSHGYRDSLGWLTIGIGRMIDERRGGGITKQEAFYLLDNDIRNVCKDLDDHMLWWRGQSDLRKRAITNMCFQMGIGKLLDFQKMLYSMQHGNYKQAAKEALDSNWAKQTPERANRIAGMIEKGYD